MINCEYCENVSTNNQVCTECGEPLVDNPVLSDVEDDEHGDHRFESDEYDGQPDEYTEWQDYMGGDDWDHGQYDEF